MKTASVVLAAFFLLNSGISGFENTLPPSINEDARVGMQLQEYNSATHSEYKINTDDDVDYILTSEQGAIPVVVENSEFSVKTYSDELLDFAVGAREAKNAEVRRESAEYEFIALEDEATYVYMNKAIGERIFVQAPEKSNDLTSFIGEDASFTYTSGNVLRGNNVIPANLPDGIGGRAKTSGTTNTAFSANVVTTYLDYAGSVPDTGLGLGTEVSFYNYVGYVGTYNGFEMSSDMGLAWSHTYSGWRPAYIMRQSGNKYVYNSTGVNVLPNNNAIYNFYKATPGYPTTLSINRMQSHNGVYRIGFTVKGKLTDMVTNGETTIVGGTGTSVSLQYKALTTIAAKYDKNMKTGTCIYSELSQVKIGPSAVTTYSTVESDSTNIPSVTPTLKFWVKK